MHTYTHTHMYIRTYPHIYMHTYTDIYIYMCMHTVMQVERKEVVYAIALKALVQSDNKP